MTWGRLVLACLWPLLAVGALAPHVRAQYRFDVWTTEQGLPHRNIHDILQTRDGYLWLTTTDGLVRFDGVRFKVFDTTNAPGFRSNRCTALFEDREGNLWIGTEDTGVMRYKDGQFTAYTTADGLPHNQVAKIQPDPDGRPLVNTYQGIGQWQGSRFRRYALDVSTLRSNNKGMVLLDRFGGVWYEDGVAVRHATPAGTTTYTRRDGLASPNIWSIFQDRQGAFWLGTKAPGVDPQQKGLLRIQDGRVTVYTAHEGLPDKWVSAFCEDREGTLWMGTNGSGLVRFRDGQFTTYTTADGIPSNNIMAICEDREGNIWLGTYDNGLCRLSRQLITPYSTRDGLAAENTYPVYEDGEGVLWIGGWSGLTRYQQGRFTRYLEKDGLIGLHMALFKDRSGSLWIGSFAALTQFKDGKFILQAGRGVKNISLGDPVVVAIQQDRDGALWFGTTEGLTRYRDGAATIYTMKDGLPHNYIKCIHETRDGTLWVGTRGGLARFDGTRFVTFAQPEALFGEHVRCIYEDADGVLWIGTYDAGLTRFKDGRFTRYRMKDGLFNNGVFQILEDHRGNLWMSCNRGIYRVSKRELNEFADGKRRLVTSVSYGKKDGMLDEECNGGMQPAGCRASDGKLWFPTQKGAVAVDPEAIPVNTQPPPVFIEEFILNGKLQELRQLVRILPGAGDFEVHYTGLSLVKSEQVQFKYQLVGLDEDWVEAGARRVAYYNHVPPGNYVFKVIAANSDGVWNMAGASLRVTVVPPFWRRWWFVTLSVAGIAGLLLLGYRRRITQLERARAAQEQFSRQLIASEERERKRVAAELHDSLGQRLVFVKNMLLMHLRGLAANGQQNERLDEISTEVSQAIAEVKEISYNLRPHQLDQLGLSKALKALLKRASDSSGVAFSAEIEPMDGLLTLEAEISLYRIVQEGVNNIVKHAGATAARVTLFRDAAGVRLEIRDNGRGFAPDTTTSETGGRGFGLIGIVERARLLGGRPQIQSAPGEGTTITIELELRNGHPTNSN